MLHLIAYQQGMVKIKMFRLLNLCAEKMCQVYGSYIGNVLFCNYDVFIKNMPLHGVVFWRKAWKKFGMVGSFHISIPHDWHPIGVGEKKSTGCLDCLRPAHQRKKHPAQYFWMITYDIGFGDV